MSQELTLEINRDELQVLIAALDVYAGTTYLRSQEVRHGDVATVPDEGLPAAGLDADRLMQLHFDAEKIVDRLLELIPPHETITATYEDGTPLGRDQVEGFPVPASSALHLRRPLDPAESGKE